MATTKEELQVPETLYKIIIDKTKWHFSKRVHEALEDGWEMAPWADRHASIPTTTETGKEQFAMELVKLPPATETEA